MPDSNAFAGADLVDLPEPDGAEGRAAAHAELLTVIRAFKRWQQGHEGAFPAEPFARHVIDVNVSLDLIKAALEPEPDP